MTTEQRTTALEAIAAEVRGCTRCRLSEGRTRAVPGEGSPDTEVVFVGEGPGQNEDQQGRPFVGAAGGLLTELIASIGWRRDQVFITNVVKCRPPGNRDPEPDEMAACAPFLRRQLEVLDPALVVTLGRHSLGTFMPGARIGQVHGTSRAVDAATGARDALAFAMYHPAAAFRQLSLKETMREDMARVPATLIEARATRERLAPPTVGPEGIPAPEASAEPEGIPAPEALVEPAHPVEQEAPPEPADMTAYPDEPEPIEPVAAYTPVDMLVIPTGHPTETDQMRLF